MTTDTSTAGGYELTGAPARRREVYGDVVDRDAVIDSHLAENSRRANPNGHIGAGDSAPVSEFGRVNVAVWYIAFGIAAGLLVGFLGFQSLTHRSSVIEGRAMVTNVEEWGSDEDARYVIDISGAHEWKHRPLVQDFDAASRAFLSRNDQFPVTVTYSTVTGGLTGVEELGYEAAGLNRVVFPALLGIASLVTVYLTAHFVMREGGRFTAFVFAIGVAAGLPIGYFVIPSLLWS